LETKTLRANDFCRTDMITADEHASLYQISKLMRDHHIGDVVITRTEDSHQLPIGVVTDRDIVVHGIACDVDLDEVAAGDLSTQDLVAVDEDADIFEIARTMNMHAVRRVLVKRKSQFVGIITLDDILWALSLIVSNLGAVPERQIQHESLAEV
jgi:CBS domain-containing protein